jgi:hypothetical protein
MDRALLVIVIVVLLLPSMALGQNVLSPRARAVANPTATSNATSSSQGGQGGVGQGGTAQGGRSASGATANPTAASGSSQVDIQTGNTISNIPADTVIRSAPLLYVPSVNTGNVCALGASAGASWIASAFAFGVSWESMQCERRQTAALLWNMNTPESRAAAKEVICNSPEIRAAYKVVGSPCAADMAQAASVMASAPAAPRALLPPTPVAFDPAPYRSGSECLMAAQRVGALLSLCAGKP